jgi:hypothetical protein
LHVEHEEDGIIDNFYCQEGFEAFSDEFGEGMACGGMVGCGEIFFSGRWSDGRFSGARTKL